MENFRDNGAVGALLDEYEKAIIELQKLLETVTQEELITIVDPETADDDCRSIQTILNHVIRAGYSYVRAVRKNQSEKMEIIHWEPLTSIPEYKSELSKMFKYNEQLFEDYPNLVLEEYDNSKKFWFPGGNFTMLSNCLNMQLSMF